MYVIANEKGINKYGVMEYELFGAKLKTLHNVREVLKESQLFHVLDDDSSIFNKVLLGNFIDSGLLDFLSDKHNGSIDESKKFRSVLADKQRLLVRKFEKYFDTINNNANTLYLTRSMLDNLKAFRALEFEILQVTEKQKAFSKPYADLMFYQNNLGISRRNAAILMFLTGKTYYNSDDKQIPLIINGMDRSNISWREIPCTSGPLKVLSRH